MGDGITGWRRAEQLQQPSLHCGPWREKPPSLSFLFLSLHLHYLRGALGSRGFQKHQSLSLLILAHRASGPGSLALGPASPSVFPKGNLGPQRLGCFPCPLPLERGSLIKREPAMYTSDKSNILNKLIKTLCLQHISFLSSFFDLRCVFKKCHRTVKQAMERYFLIVCGAVQRIV